MTSLSESTSVITNVITENIQDYIQWTTQSMLDGNTIIYNNEDGTQYELTTEQMDVFNAAYADGLANSTPEALTAVLLNDMIDVEQGTYEEEKRRSDRRCERYSGSHRDSRDDLSMVINKLRSMLNNMQLTMTLGQSRSLVVNNSIQVSLEC